MKITLINRDDSGGGAAIACHRLFKALENSNIDVNLLVQNKSSKDERIVSTIHNKIDRVRANYNFLFERLSFIPQERDKSVRFAFSTANAGTSIESEQPVRNADILHLHWINGGFLSLDSLNHLFQLNKPVVWTLHDMWPFTGGCHYSGSSLRFLQECGNCHFLRHPSQIDISHRGWLRKREIYQRNRNITFVACSHWMEEMAKKSSLLQNFNVLTIPNPIDIEVYSRQDKTRSREKWNVNKKAKVILFGAANINHTRKGIKYLIDALWEIRRSSKTFKEDIQVVVFGKSKGFDFERIPFPVINLPVIKSEEQLAEIYSLADVFVLPSLEDNLPNMVMEALSCSTPVVAFDSGGVKDMIDHGVNGYLAKVLSVTDLARGLITILEGDHEFLSANARKKVVENFSYEIIAKKHLDLYESLMPKSS